MDTLDSQKVKYGQIFELNGVNYMIVQKYKYCNYGTQVVVYPTVIDLNTYSIIPDSFGKHIIMAVSDIVPRLYNVSENHNPLDPVYPKL